MNQMIECRFIKFNVTLFECVLRKVIELQTQLLKVGIFMGLVATLGICGQFATQTQAKEPVKLIYDTDMGNDIDDVFDD